MGRPLKRIGTFQGWYCAVDAYSVLCSFNQLVDILSNFMHVSISSSPTFADDLPKRNTCCAGQRVQSWPFDSKRITTAVTSRRRGVQIILAFFPSENTQRHVLYEKLNISVRTVTSPSMASSMSVSKGNAVDLRSRS